MISDGKTVQVIMHTRQDVYKFMSVLPKPIDRLRQPKLDPIGLRSMDLKSYIAAVCIKATSDVLCEIADSSHFLDIFYQDPQLKE